MAPTKRTRSGTAKGKLTAKVQKATEVAEASSASDSEVGTSGSDSGSDSEYDKMTKESKKSKKHDADAQEFSTILTSILGQTTPSAAPIMAKDRTREQQIKDELLSYRARKALVHEKRMLLSKDRVIPTMEGFDYERKLRKVATRGVVKLFNVVKAQQTELDQIETIPSRRTERVAEMSKSKFVDLLKAKTS
ncbi:Rrp15p-domain-containing protein [Linderina pennispora]|uniref:Rrp15p-domain-containing protein n=1 Tax=Linderina pennispora TaxID=61395 RepID=A0A1Y1WPB2_9FUNG|nr:Rrp15p-domain-containing protein [Linderina pennispora]ORX74954.1 Rrp15p-domain-containing protein [Linderina pennispora]